MVCIFPFMCIILQQKFIFKNARKYLSYGAKAALLLTNAYVLKGSDRTHFLLLAANSKREIYLYSKILLSVPADDIL